MVVEVYTYRMGEEYSRTHKDSNSTQVDYHRKGERSYDSVVNIFDGGKILVSLRGRVVHDAVKKVLRGSSKETLVAIRGYVDRLIEGEGVL